MASHEPEWLISGAKEHPLPLDKYARTMSNEGAERMARELAEARAVRDRKSPPWLIPERPQASISAQPPLPAFQNFLSERFPDLYDAVASFGRKHRVPEAQANPFEFLMDVSGLGPVLRGEEPSFALAEGPVAAAMGPVRRGAKEASKRAGDAVQIVREPLTKYRTRLSALLDGKEVGYTKYAVQGDAPGGIQIEEVVVKPEFRRQGVGTRMYEDILEQNPDAKWFDSGQRSQLGAMFRAAWDKRRAAREAPAAARRFMGPTSDIASDAGYLYHGTNVERAADIASSRLRTWRPNVFTEQDVWPDLSREARSYFSQRADATRHFLPEGEPALLRVKQDARFRRERGTGDFYTNKSLKPEELEVFTDEGWVSLKKAFDK